MSLDGRAALSEARLEVIDKLGAAAMADGAGHVVVAGDGLDCISLFRPSEVRRHTPVNWELLLLVGSTSLRSDWHLAPN